MDVVEMSARIILCMRPVNQRWRYIITPSLIGWAHTQNDPCWCQYIPHKLLPHSVWTGLYVQSRTASWQLMFWLLILQDQERIMLFTKLNISMLRNNVKRKIIFSLVDHNWSCKGELLWSLRKVTTSPSMQSVFCYKENTLFDTDHAS